MLTACLIIGSGCSTDTAGSIEPPDSTAIPDGGLPGLDSLARPEPRSTLNHEGFASDCLAVSPNAVVSSGIVSLPSQQQQLEWAIWGWYGMHDGDYPEGITVATAGGSGEFWIMVSDFHRMGWRSFGPFTENFTQLDLSAEKNRLSGKDGVFYVAIATWDGEAQEIRAITVDTAAAGDVTALRQCWISASQDSAPDTVSVSWSRPLADTQRLCRWRAGEDESLAQLLPALAGTTEFSDATAPQGEYLYYRILNSELGRLRPASPVALGRAGSPADGRRLTGQMIYDAWHNAAGRELYLTGVELRASSDENGYFSFPALPPGSYSLYSLSGQQQKLMGHYDISIADFDSGQHVAELHGIPRADWYWLYPPTNLQAENLGSASLRLSWNAVKFASHYEVYRSLNSDNSSAVLIGSTSATEIVLAAEPSGMNYYSIVAVDEPFDRRSAHTGTLGFASAGGFSPDSIYAVASRTKVSAGEKVRITVFASQCASPLLYLDGVRVVFEAGNRYSADSFNIGMPGGERYEPDGVWSNICGDLGFLEVPDLWWKEKALDGQSCIDFNITPINGRQRESVSGPLFSFELEVWEDTGFSFQRMDNWNRTYYSGADNQPVYWSDDSNSGMPGIDVVND